VLDMRLGVDLLAHVLIENYLYLCLTLFTSFKLRAELMVNRARRSSYSYYKTRLESLAARPAVPAATHHAGMARPAEPVPAFPTSLAFANTNTLAQGQRIPTLGESCL
jgi:hypothetical protein